MIGTFVILAFAVSDASHAVPSDIPQVQCQKGNERSETEAHTNSVANVWQRHVGDCGNLKNEYVIDGSCGATHQHKQNWYRHWLRRKRRFVLIVLYVSSG